MDKELLRESAILSYIGLASDYEPRPSTSPIEFLQKHLHLLPPHLIVGFSAVTTPKERSVIAAIRNRRLAYAETRPKQLEAHLRLCTEHGRSGQEAAKEEREWAEKGFLGGGAQKVGKLGALLGDYEEERIRRGRRAEEFVPEEDSDESAEESAETVERRIKELFIYGLLEGADYGGVDWDEQYDNDDSEERYFDAE